MSHRFYVYALIDPRCGSMFYVGKGQNRRAWMHETCVRRGRVSNAAKTERITSIIDAGMSVRVEILSRHTLERDAYQAEAELISRIGLSNLTNYLPGGSGSCSDLEWSRKAREMRSALDALKLLASMGDESSWIADRRYSLEDGQLWYRRMTGLLRDLVAKIIDRCGEATFREYVKRYAH